jgi:hypothetical protein
MKKKIGINALIHVLIILFFLFITFFLIGVQYKETETNVTHVDEDKSNILVNLNLNRYPWLCAHDAATGYNGPILSRATRITLTPLTKTQKLPFDRQFINGGVRMFDLRVDLYNDDTTIRFKHGPIKLQLMGKDPAFKRLMNLAINKKDIIILYFSHFKSSHKSKINDDILNYFKINNFHEHVTKLTSTEQLSTPYKTFLNDQKYILWFTDKLLIDNWKQHITCFQDESYASFSSCKQVTCMNPDSQTHKQLFKYIDDTYKKYIDTKQKQFFMIQTMFQAAPNVSQIVQSLCFGAHSQAILIENYTKLNRKLTKYVKDKKLAQNIVTCDNIGKDTVNLINAIKNNIIKFGSKVSL